MVWRRVPCGVVWRGGGVQCRLVEAFGSTRRKRQLQQRAEGTVVVEGNAAAAELDVMMQEVQRRAQAAGDTREEIMGRLAANRVVPAHNPLATTPEVGGWVGERITIHNHHACFRALAT